MELELFDCGKPVGRLSLEKTGLYQTVDCSCRPESEGILRVFVWKGTEGACLGVLCPEGMDFTLRKRVSKAGLPFTPEIAVIGCEDDGFWPWRGEYDGAWIDDGYLAHTPDGEKLAVPFTEGMEYPFVHRLQRTEQRVICGRDCIVLLPGEELPEEESPAPEAPVELSPERTPAELAEAPEETTPPMPQQDYAEVPLAPLQDLSEVPHRQPPVPEDVTPSQMREELTEPNLRFHAQQ